MTKLEAFNQLVSIVNVTRNESVLPTVDEVDESILPSIGEANEVVSGVQNFGLFLDGGGETNTPKSEVFNDPSDAKGTELKSGIETQIKFY